MLPPSAERLVTELERLPGVGRRPAQRLAFHLLRVPEPEALGLAEALREVRERISFCTVCYSLAEGELCVTCADPRRDTTQICVVETPSDVVPIERTASYRGLSHVLGGALSPRTAGCPSSSAARCPRWPARTRATCGSASWCGGSRAAASRRWSSPRIRR